MRHANSNRRFGKTATHRKAMFRNMATSLLEVEQFYTTLEKAKDLRKIVEPLITLGKEDTLHARRLAYGYLMNKQVVHKLFSDIGPRFKARDGGYLRIIRADRRHGDAAAMAYVQLVDKANPEAIKAFEEKAAAKKAAKKAAAPKKEAAPKAPKAAKVAKAPKAKAEKKPAKAKK